MINLSKSSGFCAITYIELKVHCITQEKFEIAVVKLVVMQLDLCELLILFEQTEAYLLVQLIIEHY